MEGRRELPAACCRACATIIGKFEDKFFKGTMETAREHLGLHGRQKIKGRTKLPVRLLGGRTYVVAKEDHPSLLISPRLQPPGFMLGAQLSNALEWGIAQPVLCEVTEDAIGKARRIGRLVNLTRGVGADHCYRQIAKIAHSFAAGELGIGAFIPLTLNLIRGREPMLAGYCVGSAITSEPPTDRLHEIGFRDSVHTPAGELLVVRLRLFAFLPASVTHYVAVGIRTPPMPSQPEASPQQGLILR
jgi:hypothetical protein